MSPVMITCDVYTSLGLFVIEVEFSLGGDVMHSLHNVYSNQESVKKHTMLVICYGDRCKVSHFWGITLSKSYFSA